MHGAVQADEFYIVRWFLALRRGRSGENRDWY
jgi:hypothetical protein